MGPKGAAASGSSSRKAPSSVCRSSSFHTRLKSSLTKANDITEGNEQTNDEDEEEEVDDEDDNDGNDNTGLQEDVVTEGDNDAVDENVEEIEAEDGGEENDADDGGEENDGDDDEEEEDDREVRQPKKRRRRQWELWSSQDKDIFFEAINECGKNFDSIQAFFQSRNQKKGLPASQGKNKDQVRHFYYRTWHKISKYISFAGNAKKSTQEIYGLVNYGEFRRRVGGTLDYKRGLKLRELVLQGTTSVRLKGRSIRIRTPQCRALKKFNQPQDASQGSEPLPRRVSVLLSAGSSSAWTHVHSLAHNPRLRTALSPNRPLRDLLVFLQHKWRLKQLKTVAIIGLHRAGKTKPEIVKLLKAPKLTVYHTLARFKEVGTTGDCPRSGRPRTFRTPKNIKEVNEENGKSNAFTRDNITPLQCASILKKSSRSVAVPEVEEPLLRVRPPPQCTVSLSRITQIRWGADPPLIKLRGGSMRPGIPPSIFNVASPKPAPRLAKVEDQQLWYFLQKDKITSFDAFKPERYLQKQYKNLIISRPKERLVWLFMTDNFSECSLSVIIENKPTLCSPLRLSVFKNGISVQLFKTLHPNNGLRSYTSSTKLCAWR
ncbi:Homeobox domain-like [Trinorchestia longiramus]|nr:Homeobox domain-like [Trinorchestia longiramus]